MRDNAECDNVRIEGIAYRGIRLGIVRDKTERDKISDKV